MTNNDVSSTDENSDGSPASQADSVVTVKRYLPGPALDAIDASPPPGPVVRLSAKDNINMTVDSVDVGIQIEYDARDNLRPFTYHLSFPEEMASFFIDAGLTSNTDTYRGNPGGTRSCTANEARRTAEFEVKRTVNRYTKHLSDKQDVENYLFTVTV